MGGSKPKASSNWLRSSVEKMKKLVAPVEGRLFCVVCKVPRPGDVVVQRVPDSINRTGYDASVHPDVHVVERVHKSIRLCGYACIVLRDFENLKMMYGVDWKKIHLDIFRHKKKDAYALLYSGDLSHDAENAMKNHFESKISEIVDNYQSFCGNTHVKILTIEGTKTSNGRHLSCDFVDVLHAEVILRSYKKTHGAGDTVMVEPDPDEV